MKEMNPAMKKTIAWILASAMFSTSAMALAENTPPQMPQGENGQPPEMPNGQKPGNPPDGGMGGPGGQKPDGALPSGGGPKPDDDTPRSKPTGEMPQKDSGNAKA